MTSKKVCTCPVQKQFVILKHFWSRVGSIYGYELSDMEPADTEGRQYWYFKITPTIILTNAEKLQ